MSYFEQFETCIVFKYMLQYLAQKEEYII